MPQTPESILESGFKNASGKLVSALLSALPSDYIQDLQTIVANAETQKAVLGVTLTSIVYKIYKPSQDIRYHQDGMENGYSGRTFDTKYVMPFLKRRFPHFAMAESAWLTRSLEQPHPFDFEFPGKIRNANLKSAFLKTLDRLQINRKLASKMLAAFMGLMIQASAQDGALFENVQVASGLSIAQMIDAVSAHIHYDYGRGATGTARIPVLAIYSVYNLLLKEGFPRYAGKVLAPLESHTSPDARSRSVGDIEIKNTDGSYLEAVEIKHDKPLTADMVGVAYRKIKNTDIDRYYILTTHEPNFDDYDAIMQEIRNYSKVHSCQIIINGVIPSLKYYMRLMNNPQAFVDEYTKWLEFEYQRASGIKRKHLQVWQEIRQKMLEEK
jgi:DNA (cytosine-5)-methyltransferase 1